MALANDVLIPVSVNEDKNEDADCIASKIATVLIDAFKVREGREPNNEEMEDLFNEITEERVQDLLNGVNRDVINDSDGDCSPDEEGDSVSDEEVPGVLDAERKVALFDEEIVQSSNSANEENLEENLLQAVKKRKLSEDESKSSTI